MNYFRIDLAVRNKSILFSLMNYFYYMDLATRLTRQKVTKIFRNSLLDVSIFGGQIEDSMVLFGCEKKNIVRIIGKMQLKAKYSLTLPNTAKCYPMNSKIYPNLSKKYILYYITHRKHYYNIALKFSTSLLFHLSVVYIVDLQLIGMWKLYLPSQAPSSIALTFYTISC